MKKLTSTELQHLTEGLKVLQHHFPGIPWWSVRLGVTPGLDKRPGRIFVNDQEVTVGD